MVTEIWRVFLIFSKPILKFYKIIHCDFILLVSKTYYRKENLHLLETEKKLALSIKTKLYNIRVNFHEITINEKEVPSLKISDPTIEAVDRPDSRRAITTSSRNRQTLQNRQKYIKLRSPKLQLNWKTSTKILANQTQSKLKRNQKQRYTQNI